MANDTEIDIPFTSKADQFIAEAKKVQKEMDELTAKLKDAGVSQGAYNKAVAANNEAMKKQEQSVASAKMSWTDFRSMYQTVLDVVKVGQQVWDETGQKFVNYALEVGQSARTMGTTTEEASRLIQVADDAGISFDALKTSLKLAAKDGFEPTIAGLMAMADEYNSLAPGVERTQFLLDRFGKSGDEMGKLLEKGSAGIQEMSDAIDANLIVTEEGYRQAEQYRIAVDNLSDAWDGFSMAIGKSAVPAATDLLTAAQKNIDELSTWQKVLYGIPIYGQIKAYQDLKAAHEENTKALSEENATGTDAAGVFETEAEKAQRLAEAEKAAAEAAKEHSDANKLVIDTLGNVAKANEDYNTKLDDLNAKFEDSKYVTDLYKQKLDELLQAHRNGETTSQEYGDAVKALQADYADGTLATQEHQKAVDALSAEYEDAKNKIVLSIVEMKLASDGWTDAELNAYLKIGQGLGQFTQEQVDQTNAVLKQADRLVAGVDNMGDNIYHTGERAEDASAQFGIMADGQSRLADRINSEATPAVAGLKSSINGLQNKTVNIDVYIQTHGGMPGSTGLGGSGLGGGVSLCFVKGTLVTMADGTLKPIEETQIGDSVRGYNVMTYDFLAGTVTKKFYHTAVFYLNIDGLKVTPEHPIWNNTRRMFVEANDVRVGDVLLLDDGGTRIVEQISSSTDFVEVYNLEVDSVHTYFAGGVLVHNKDLEGENRDVGGPGVQGGIYMIGKGAQPEAFVAPSSGTFVPNADKVLGNNQELIDAIMQSRTDEKKLARAIVTAFSQAGG